MGAAYTNLSNFMYVIHTFIYLFIYFQKESAHAHMHVCKGGAERGRERIPSRLRAVSTEPSVGLKLTNHEIMT